MNEFNQKRFNMYIESAFRLIKIAMTDLDAGVLQDAKQELDEVYKYLNDMSIEIDKLDKSDNRHKDLTFWMTVTRSRYNEAYSAYLKAACII